jgi:hypothetical protein
MLIHISLDIYVSRKEFAKHCRICFLGLIMPNDYSLLIPKDYYGLRTHMEKEYRFASTISSKINLNKCSSRWGFVHYRKYQGSPPNKRVIDADSETDRTWTDSCISAEYADHYQDWASPEKSRNSNSSNQRKIKI